MCNSAANNVIVDFSDVSVSTPVIEGWTRDTMGKQFR
jgi:hypothetical protein